MTSEDKLYVVQCVSENVHFLSAMTILPASMLIKFGRTDS